MSMPEIQLELLLNKRVRDAAGKPAGRIEEIRAKQEDGEWVLSEYLVGRYGWCERMAVWPLIRSLLRRLPWPDVGVGFRIPWNQLDLAEPAAPRLRCLREELPRL